MPPPAGELKGLEPEGKVACMEEVLMEVRGCRGKAGTVRGELDPISVLE